MQPTSNKLPNQDNMKDRWSNYIPCNIIQEFTGREVLDKWQPPLESLELFKP